WDLRGELWRSGAGGRTRLPDGRGGRGGRRARAPGASGRPDRREEPLCAGDARARAARAVVRLPRAFGGREVLLALVHGLDRAGFRARLLARRRTGDAVHAGRGPRVGPDRRAQGTVRGGRDG